MDCCEDLESKGGKTKMDTKNLVMWIVIAILVIAVIYVVFFQGAASTSAIPAGNAATSASSSYGGMVGGC